MTIEERLETLEQELRRAKRHARLTAISAIVLAAVALTGFLTSPIDVADARQAGGDEKVIRANKFVVEDKDGKERATLGIDETTCDLRIFNKDGERVELSAGDLRMVDKDGKHRVVLRADGAFLMDDGQGKDSIFLTTDKISLNKDGKPRVTLRATTEIDPIPYEEKDRGIFEPLQFRVAQGLCLYDENGKPRNGFFMTGTEPELYMSDEAGTNRVELRVREGVPVLNLKDENGKNRGIFGLTDAGPMLFMSDAGGTYRLGVGVVEGRPQLNLKDENGKNRGIFGLTDDGPSLLLLDHEEKIRLTLGAGKFTETPDGKTIIHPESSILLFGPDGKLRWSAE